MRKRTGLTAAVGPFFSPLVAKSNICSRGYGSSHATVISGESHLTIEEGSSNRMIRFSNLVSAVDQLGGARQVGRFDRLAGAESDCT